MPRPHPFEKRDLLPWGVSAACFGLSVAFPSHAAAIWLVGITSLLFLLVVELRKPVNYHALVFDTRGYCFRLHADRVEHVKWSEIADVFYLRLFNDFANQIDTEWEFHLHDGSRATVLVEWPDRSRFAHAIIRNLPQVSAEKVSKVTRRRDEGRWSVVADPA